MAAHEHLGRQFLDRHLVEHHGWQENWLRDYDDDPSGEAINEEHSSEHKLMSVGVNDLDTPIPHTHSPERIHFE